MTKEELIRLVVLELGGGNVPASVQAQYTPQQVEKLLEMVFDDMTYQAYLFGMKTGNYENLDMFVKPYKMPILTDTTRDERYSILPTRGSSIPDTVAVRQLSPTKGQRLAFSPIENYSMSVWDELEVSKVDSRVSFYVENGRVYYDDKLPSTTEEVLAKVVTPFSDYQDTDVVFVPLGQNTELYGKVVDILMKNGTPSNNDDMTGKQL